nr:hypothetical protein [Tanacetum cinerariifolium]
MSTQQDIYVAGSENRPLMINKDNYVPWSSCIIRYARSRPNGKMIVNSIKNGPYVRRMIATPGEPDLPVPVPESLHEQTDEELTKTDIKRMDADDQAIQTILLGLPEDVYVAADSCETAKEIWESVRQMMKGSDIGEQEKKEKLFNEWEKFTSTDGESIESYYHRFMQLMNDLKRNKHFPKNIASNLNTHPQQSFPINNKYNPQPLLNQIFMQPKMTSLEDINDPTEAINAALILFTKAFQLSAPTNNNQRTSSNPRNRQIAKPVMNMSQDRQIQNVGGNGGNQFGQYAGQVVQNQQGFNAWQNGRIQSAQNAGVQSGGNQNGLVVVPGIANQSRTGNVVAARAEGTGIGNQAKCYNCRGLGIQLQAKEFDFMVAASELDEIEEVNANCILTANLQQASTSGTQHDRAPVYDTDGSAENDNHVTSVALSMVHSGGTVETSFAPNEEIRAHQETDYRNLVDQVAQDLSDDTTLSVARKFLNEVKSSLVTLQRVVKQKLTLEVHNRSSSAHKEVHIIISHEISPIINQVDARVQNFKIQFLQEAAKFVRDFKSLAKEADESLDKQKSLELEIERLLKASVSHDIMSIVQNSLVDVPSNLRTELDRTKENF